jgi:hypothetical protein
MMKRKILDKLENVLSVLPKELMTAIEILGLILLILIAVFAFKLQKDAYLNEENCKEFSEYELNLISQAELRYKNSKILYLNASLDPSVNTRTLNILKLDVYNNKLELDYALESSGCYSVYEDNIGFKYFNIKDSSEKDAMTVMMEVLLNFDRSLYEDVSEVIESLDEDTTITTFDVYTTTLEIVSRNDTLMNKLPKEVKVGIVRNLVLERNSRLALRSGRYDYLDTLIKKFEGVPLYGENR